ncbi:hypothetical protein MLD38_006388 [Melastoma candidum]|uniref:Uncharacterized protein n=1 Tax=Melastoma candidum TaxID=119954 RepID=A0ACB9RNZ8_9MYRT|nr:hypothetical protein MLD38_006388 [Melastoma candidum]
MLRSLFPDAGTFDKDLNSGGMNGSIVYELKMPENAGLTKPVLEKPKAAVDSKKPEWGISVLRMLFMKGRPMQKGDFRRKN